MYAWQQDVPINAAVYARIRDDLGSPAPDGLIVHVAFELPEGGLRYLDVWRSREDCDRFTDERLHPVVGKALAEADIRPDREPPRNEIKILDVWGSSLDEQATTSA
jgi:hypothetical protein